MSNSETYEDFLQNLANYVIECYLATGRNPPIDKLEELLNELIVSDWEHRHFEKVKSL
jgi:hypothetical protein